MALMHRLPLKGLWIVLVTFLLEAPLAVMAQKPELFFYKHNEVVRQGCYYKPEGKGPFPVMIYNQATPKPSLELGDSAPFLSLAKFYTAKGYVLCLPGRPLLTEVQAPASSNKKATLTDEELMKIVKAHNENIAGAIVGIKAQAIADPNYIYMSGHAMGAIQTVLLAEENLGIRGYVAFSPGAMLWDLHPALRSSLLHAVKNQKAPLFLIQPQNDLGFGPSIALAPVLKEIGPPNRSFVFGPFGKSPAEGHSFAFNAPSVWGNDVLEFLESCKEWNTAKEPSGLLADQLKK